MAEEIYDVVIVGGGPAGLTAAQYATRARLKAVVLDKSSTAGALAYTGKIENYPGVKPISGRGLLDIFRGQAVDFGAEYHDDVQVIGASLAGEVKEIFTMDASFRGKTVIIATGSMGRKPTIKGEGELLGRGVSYCAICDANFFRGKKVCVLGDSEEAVKEAVLLTRFAETVYLLAPGKALKVDSSYPGLDAPNLKIMLSSPVREIRGSEGVEGVVYSSEGREEFLALDGVFVYIHGSRPIVDFLQGSIELGEGECVKVGGHMETSIPGVFAAGDVVCSEVRQVVVAAAQGALAALSAEKYLHGRGKLKSDWAKSLN